MYTIILNDGTKIENLELNGNNYISAVSLSDSDFDGKLDTVTIIDAEGKETVHTDMELGACRQMDDGRYWFILQQKSKQQIAQEKMKALIDSHTAGLTEVELALVEIYELMIGG